MATKSSAIAADQRRAWGTRRTNYPSPEQTRRSITPDDPTRTALDAAAWYALDACKLYKEGNRSAAELRNLDTLSKAAAAGYFLATDRINRPGQVPAEKGQDR